jgi:perosamine synthetase
MKIALAKPELGLRELEFATEAIQSGQISGSGKFINQMEKNLASYTGREYCVAVANGTVALHLALLALEIGAGDEVIIPDFGYVAFANAVLYVGAIPIMVDIEADSWGMDPLEVRKHITSRTKALIIVHNYGLAGDIQSLIEIAQEFDLKLIEDAAEALCGEYRGKKLGSLGDISTFSFFGNKILTSGEGGAILTNRVELDVKIRLLRGQGMDPKRRYWFSELGYNYRLSNLQASVFCAQFEKLDEFSQKRKLLFTRYEEIIKSIGTSLFKSNDSYAPWLFTFLLNEGLDRDDFMHFLEKQGIETRPAFSAIHLLPEYQKYSKSEYIESTTVSNRGVSLPTFAGMSEAEFSYIEEAIKLYGAVDRL